MAPVRINLVTELESLSNDDLRRVIASEVLQWRDIHLTASGRLVGVSAKGFIHAPAEIPNWPIDATLWPFLESVLDSRGLGTRYHQELKKLAGTDDANVSPRHRAEAAVLAARAVSVGSTA